MLAKIQSDLSPSDPLYKAVSYQLGENMREVYGTPEPEHWRGILGYRLSLLAEVEGRVDVPAEVREAWEFVKDALPQDLPIQKPYQPQAETMQWYRERLEERIEPARTAFDSLRRLFRGTDGRTPGVVFTKDAMTYYLGQTEVWRKWDADMDLPESERLAEHELERSAKINPLRPDHRRIAQRALARTV